MFHFHEFQTSRFKSSLTRRRIVGVGLAIAVLSLLALPAANALDNTSPQLKVVLFDQDVLAISGRNFPSNASVVTTAATNGLAISPSSTSTTSGSGRFFANFILPSQTFAGRVTITAKAGSVVASKTLSIRGGGTGGNTPTTTSTTTSTVPSTVAYDANGVAATNLTLSSTNVGVGQNVTASVTVLTNHTVTFKQFAVSMRDSRNVDGPDLDFDHDQNRTVNGSQVITHSRSEDHADTYKVDLAYTLDGQNWTRLTSPTSAFTVTAGTTAPPVTAPASTTTTIVSPPVSTGGSTPSQPDIAGNWKLSFDDEFNGSTLDTTKWIMCNPSFANSCVPYNDEQETFRTTPNNPNVQENGGLLHLIATKENGKVYSGMISTGPAKTANGGAIPSGTGYKPFLYTYGYYEGRVKMPKGKGFWPSMWMLPDQTIRGAWPGSGEEDVMEIPGNDPTEVHMTEHDGNTGGAGDSTVIHMADTSADFHTFGIDWEPGSLKWYIDGKLQKTFTGNGVKDFPFYIIANFSVGGPGSWGGAGGPLAGGMDNSTPFPAEMDLDWIRVWQHA